MLIKLHTGYINPDHIVAILQQYTPDNTPLKGPYYKIILDNWPAIQVSNVEVNVLLKGISSSTVLPPPYAYETKEGELLYTEKAREDYNKTYNNRLGKYDALYTREQVDELLHQVGVEVSDDD